MEDDDKDPQQGGGGAVGVRIFLKNCVAGGVDIRIRDLGSHSPHGQSPGEFTRPGGAAADREACAAEKLREVGIHLGGDDK